MCPADGITLAELKGDEFVIQFIDGPAFTLSMNVWQKRTPAVATGSAMSQKMERLSWTMCRSGRFDHSSSDRGINWDLLCDESEPTGKEKKSRSDFASTFLLVRNQVTHKYEDQQEMRQ